MISFDNLLWSPCVSQACWWVGICQEGEYIWEGLLFSSQTWLSTFKAFVTAPQFLTEEELCSHRRGLEKYKVLILSFRTSLRHLSFPHELLYVVFCTYLENTPWFISSARLLFTETLKDKEQRITFALLEFYRNTVTWPMKTAARIKDSNTKKCAASVVVLFCR